VSARGEDLAVFPPTGRLKQENFLPLDLRCRRDYRLGDLAYYLRIAGNQPGRVRLRFVYYRLRSLKHAIEEGLDALRRNQVRCRQPVENGAERRSNLGGDRGKLVMNAGEALNDNSQLLASGLALDAIALPIDGGLRNHNLRIDRRQRVSDRGPFVAQALDERRLLGRGVEVGSFQQVPLAGGNCLVEALLGNG
jgi:hypothetical protein